MFVRKKSNKSGSVSVQIISKKGGKYKVVKTVGSSNDPDEVKTLVLRAKVLINKPKENQQKLFPLKTRDALAVEAFLSNLSNTQILTVGPELIYGKLFDRLGFNAVPDELFRHLVVSRLAWPLSKLKTLDYLYRYRGIKISKDKVYRFLDCLGSKYKNLVEDISYQQTARLLKSISVVFYDMTTLYFEASDEDDLRKIGFSKDGKFKRPQIMLGLLVGKRGLPIGYNIFEGNTYEGHTLIPILESFQKRYGFKEPVVIADAALLTKKNLSSLSKQEYKFIIGGKIKSESDKVKKKILERAKSIKDGEGFSISKDAGLRLVVTYSAKRAKKDSHNRKRGVKKLRQKVKSGKLTKQNINNRGYNKFLKLKGKVKIEIDEGKIKEDKKWDGLKGYVTNTKLSVSEIAENYNQLWLIERAFRISKTDLRIRPIYHHRKRRVEAHVCIAFVAYTIYKELERLLDKYATGISPRKAAELTQNIYELEYILPQEAEKQKILLKMDKEQKLLYEVVRKG